ncbi:MAG: FAD-dependent monooxygenase [Solirubrobacterales bacterium]|nr:FAD-dependent monooxygenase [Solirubrobacterales bacterium]MBV9715576.1 FAD-dependent monooxygenase [Solirubrobacterales bacterium]
MTKAILVGAGIGGLAAATALSKTDVEVVSFERARNLATVELGAGITLWPNAIMVLDKLGVGQEIRARGAPLHSFEQRTRSGRLLARWPMEEMARRIGAPAIGIARPDVHAVLAQAGGYGVQTGTEVTGFIEREDAVEVTLADGRAERGDVLIGADGIESTVRAQLLGATPPRHAGLAIWRANLPIAPGVPVPDVAFMLFWGTGKKFVVFHSGPRQLSWEAIVRAERGGSDPPGMSKDVVLTYFKRFADPVRTLIEATDPNAVFRTDVSDRPPDKHWGRGRVTLLGDAAHAMTFAVGQGAAQALEDTMALAARLDHTRDVIAPLRAYEEARMKRSAKFQGLAWRLARAGAWKAPPAAILRNIVLATSSPMVWRAQCKDMTLPEY